MNSFEDFHLENAMKNASLDDTPSKQLKTIKLQFKKKEFNEFVDAVDLFVRVSSHPKFIAVTQELLNYEKTADEVNSKMIEPISSSIFKLPGNSIKKVISSKPKGDSFFTKTHPTTDASRILFKASRGDVKLQCDNKLDTCISDVRVLVYSLIKSDPDHPELLKALAPNAMETITVVTNSNVFNIAKEIIHG